MSRQSKLTDENRVAIARRLAGGETIAIAAAAGRVNIATLVRWLARGRDAQDALNAGGKLEAKDAPYVALIAAIAEAELELTDFTRETISRLLQSGVELDVAAASAGVAPRALKRWLELGREARARADAGVPPGGADIPYLQLLAAVDEAHASAKVAAMATIQKAQLNGDWRAAAWFLERVYPDEFARTGHGGSRAGAGRPMGASSTPRPAPPSKRCRPGSARGQPDALRDENVERPRTVAAIATRRVVPGRQRRVA